MMRLLLCVLLAFALGCGDKSKDSAQDSKLKETAPAKKDTRQPESPIQSKQWKLVELNGAPVAMVAGFQNEPYISFSNESDKVHGAGGCNRFGGTYALKGDSLTFGPMSATKKFCEPAMVLEDNYIGALAAVNGYALAGDTSLTLLRDGGVLMRFSWTASN